MGNWFTEGLSDVGGAVSDAWSGAGDWLTGKYGVDKPGEWDPSLGDYSLPGYGGMSGQYRGLLGEGSRDAPQAALSQGAESDFRRRQNYLANMLTSQARGAGPGQEIARQQAQQQVDRGLGQQLAGARSARPGQSAMAARNAAMASGQLQGAGAQAATMGGLQAQQQAVGQLGGVVQGARAQDQARALANAQMANQQAMQNAQLQYQTMGLDDARQMELLRQQLAMNQMQQQGKQAYQGALGGKWGQQFGAYANAPSRLDKVLGTAGGIANAYMGFGGGGGGTPRQTGGVGYGGAQPYGQSQYGTNLMQPYGGY